MQPIDPLPPIVILSEEPRSESKNLVPYIKFAEKPLPERTTYPFLEQQDTQEVPCNPSTRYPLLSF